ncbi:MAG: hypothetical protein ACQERC_13530 [Bacteroidota bacterium]
MSTTINDRSSTVKEMLSRLLEEGADERIFLNEAQQTKYGVPLIRENYINRGSCTSNSMRDSELDLILNTLDETRSNEEWKQLRMDIASGLTNAISGEENPNYEWFFAPSGTDLVYFPLLFAKLLHPDKKVVNLITCVEELGSGTRWSGKGKYHGQYNQFGDRLSKGEDIVEGQEVETLFLSARSDNGAINNNIASIKRIIEEHPDDLVIVNLVCGSKSGIEDDLGLIDQYNAQNVLWVLDFCQFRHRREQLHAYVQKGAMIMITGSKFYESAPFSGAMMVPSSIYDQLLQVDNWSHVGNYKHIFGKYDLPEALSAKVPFREEINKAGLVRWKCALEEIVLLSAFSDDCIEQKVREWNAAVLHFFDDYDCFELMPEEEETVPSIISFRVKQDGVFLNMEHLRSLYFSIVQDHYGEQYPFDEIAIGQPVRYGDKAFLRLAVGSRTIREFIETEETTFRADQLVIEIIKDKVKEIEVN